MTTTDVRRRLGAVNALVLRAEYDSATQLERELHEEVLEEVRPLSLCNPHARALMEMAARSRLLDFERTTTE